MTLAVPGKLLSQRTIARALLRDLMSKAWTKDDRGHVGPMQNNRVGCWNLASWQVICTSERMPLPSGVQRVWPASPTRSSRAQVTASHICAEHCIWMNLQHQPKTRHLMRFLLTCALPAISLLLSQHEAAYALRQHHHLLPYNLSLLDTLSR
eukprot:COSAG02_NODE_26968_length_620_cov_0.746641_1_plen_152_part_00